MSPMTCARARSDLGWHHELHTPLIAACAHRRPSTARALLSAVVGRSDRDDGRAAERGAILASAFVNAENSVGQTALMYAARVGSEELTLWLLREGADRYHADRFGHTALDHALHQQSRPIAPSLPPRVATQGTAVAALRVERDAVDATSNAARHRRGAAHARRGHRRAALRSRGVLAAAAAMDADERRDGPRQAGR